MCEAQWHSMRRGIICAMLCLVLAIQARSASAGDSSDADRICGREFVGDQQIALQHFDSDLRLAMRVEDPTPLYFLVAWPLQVNEEGGGVIYIGNPAALDARVKDVFGEETRLAIIRTGPSDVLCRDSEVGYANGWVWASLDNAAERPRFRISVVNRAPKEAYHYGEDVWRPRFLCETKGHRVSVDQNGSGTLRYRSWNQTARLDGPPSLTLLHGSESFFGAGKCLAKKWTFANGGVSYTLFEPGCGDGSEPTASKGRLVVEGLKGGRGPISRQWCY